jgi:hypothetical protein
MEPLSDDEIAELRRIIEEEKHVTWLRKQLKVWVPLVVTIVGGLYALINWLVPRWNLPPPPH